MRGKNIASSLTPARLFRSYHVWAHCSASDRLHASSLQSEEEQQEENKFVCLSTLSLTVQITVFVSNVICIYFQLIAIVTWNTFMILSTDTETTKHTADVF